LQSRSVRRVSSSLPLRYANLAVPTLSQPLF